MKQIFFIAFIALTIFSVAFTAETKVASSETVKAATASTVAQVPTVIEAQPQEIATVSFLEKPKKKACKKAKKHKIERSTDSIAHSVTSNNLLENELGTFALM